MCLLLCSADSPCTAAARDMEICKCIMWTWFSTVFILLWLATISTTDSVLIHPLPAALIFPGVRFVSIEGEVSSYRYYNGYVAVAGETITINCDTTGYPDTQLRVSKDSLVSDVVSDSTRTTQVSAGEEIIVVMNEVTRNDSGLYICANDGKFLKVINTPDTPLITTHSCKVSNTEPSVECIFQTNTNDLDLLDWDITIQDSTSNSSEVESSRHPCIELRVLPANGSILYDQLYCLVANFFVLENKTFIITASNPFSTEVLHISPPPYERTMYIDVIPSGQPPKPSSLSDNFYTNSYYSGFVAVVGDKVVMRCTATESEILLTRFGAKENDTVTLGSEMSIVSASVRDSGKYKCGSDVQYFTVIDALDVPTVVSHQCTSNRFFTLKCTFVTTSSPQDLVRWDVTYSTRKPRTCNNDQLCQNVKCTELQMIPSASGELHDTVVCRILDWLFTFMTYDFHVVGTTPFVSETYTISSRMDDLILRLAPPTVLSLIQGTNEVFIHVQLNEQDMYSKTFGFPGFIETAVNDQGVRYKVVLGIEQEAKPKIYIYSETQTSSWLKIEGLHTSTAYAVNISMQLADTINKDVWSDQSCHNFHTL